MGRLSAAAIPGLMKRPGKHTDGDGLFLHVRKPGQGAWVARLQSGKIRRDYGLGNASLVNLSEARERCRAYRKALHEGRDPLMLRRPTEGATRLFETVAREFINAKLSPAGGRRALLRLERHVFPKIGGLQLQSISPDLAAETLRPIWQTRAETARICRAFIIRTLRFGLLDGAARTGGLARAIADRLPPQPKGLNFKALPYARVPEVMTLLEKKKGMGALALRLVILTAVRSQEARLATWDEIDWERRSWNIPPEHAKKRKPHRVPLSAAAIRILEEAASVRRSGTDLIFPGVKEDGPLSDGTLRKALRDADPVSNADKTTVHGMRSTFTDWAAEQTSFPKEVRDAAKAHAVASAVEAAYLRTTFFDKRAHLMSAWGAYCSGSTSGDVVKLADHRAS